METELARGGMGAVFVALDTTTGQRVALKRLMPGAAPRIAALFEREFHVLSSLKHPSIIEVYEYGVDAQGPFYSMELLEGSDLRELSPLPPRDACRHLRDVASSLALLHARRLLHRDVSPRNARTSRDGRCKLIDFGALTAFGTSEELVGTPPAIPPEALAGQALDQRSDLYALGALAYFLLTGQQAYAARAVVELPDAWSSPIAPPSLYAPLVPKELDELVLALLSLNLLGRPRDAADVIDRLNAIAGLEPDHGDNLARSYFAGSVLVERSQELAGVQRKLQRAASGQGAALVIDGEQGVGKTRFLEEAALAAKLVGITALRVDAREHAGAFSTARGLVQQAVRLVPRASTKAFGPHLPTLRAIWPEVFSALSSRIEGSLTPTTSDPLAELPGLLERCLLKLAMLQPLAIAVDNVEHADAQSAALLLTLARAARQERLMVLVTAQPPGEQEQSAAVRGIRDAGPALRLRALSERGTQELVQAAFGGVPHTKRTARRLFAAASGNPEDCLRLLQRWVSNGLIRYVDGAWSLPLELPEDAVLAPEQDRRGRLAQCSPAAIELASALAALDGSATLDACVRLQATERSSREVMEALEELQQAEVLAHGPLGYRFLHDALRSAVLDAMAPEAHRALRLRIGEYLLGEGDNGFDARTSAGLHILRGGQEQRGAQLIAEAARKGLDDDVDARVFAASAEALEAALAVYSANGRTRLERLELLVPLAMASFEISPEFALRYGDETIETLERAIGIWGVRSQPAALDAHGLLSLLVAAPVLEPSEVKTATTPDVITLVTWLVKTVLPLTSVAASAIDHEAEARFADALRPFTVFGPDDLASAAYDYCRLMIGMTEDHFAASHAGWSEMLVRLERLAFPPGVKRALRRGVLSSLGILETQRDDDVALERLRELEADGDPGGKAVADQLRFLYHGFRGDLETAESYRDRVEAYAVQYGSAWQVEIWSTCTLNVVYSLTRDPAGNKRAVEQLTRLKHKAPSLEQYWERAVATQHMLTNLPARAVELYERTLARPGARDRVGWGAVRSGLARAYNELGQFEHAKRICEETLEICRADLDYVAMTLNARIELVRALTGLGDFAMARELLHGMFERYQSNRNPVTMGALHRASAELALRQGELAEFEGHVQAMEDYYQPTRNPALIVQCDQLRRTVNGARGEVGVGDDASAVSSTAYTLAASVLAACRTADERMLRALQLVAAQSGVEEAFLFTRGADGEPRLSSRVGTSEPAPLLLERVRTLFEEIPDDTEDTAYEDRSDATTDAALMSLAGDHRLLALSVRDADRRVLVGTIALVLRRGYRAPNHALLEDVARLMFQAGDLVPIRRMD